MSFYNLLFGKNPKSDFILALIGLKECDVERFRDSWLDLGEEKIVVLTRTGGGNRAGYPNELLKKNKYYLYDKDDSFDCTYAYFYFKIPEEIKEDVKGLENPIEYGISSKLLKWIYKTLDREKTEKDVRFELSKEQDKVVNRLLYNHQALLWNGYVVVPLCDQAFEDLCKCAEKTEGEMLFYSIGVYKIKILERDYKYSWDKEKDKNMFVALITEPKKWEVDEFFWRRWKERYKDKYPKTITKLTEQYEKKGVKDDEE